MKQLRKNDGYVLPYVLIVFLVLSFAAVSICSISLRNLRAQEESIARTQDLYKAEGMMEKVLAQVTVQTGYGTSYGMHDGAVTSAKAEFWENVKRIEDGQPQATVDVDSGNVIAPLEVQVWNDSVTVTASVRVNMETDISEPDDTGNYSCSIDDVTYEYVSYHISHSNVEGGDGT